MRISETPIISESLLPIFIQKATYGRPSWQEVELVLNGESVIVVLDNICVSLMSKTWGWHSASGGRRYLRSGIDAEWRRKHGFVNEDGVLQPVLLHMLPYAVVFGYKPPMVDHLRDWLDNRFHWTRLVNPPINSANGGGYRGDGFPCVSYDAYHKAWKAEVCLDKQRHFGYYKTALDAWVAIQPVLYYRAYLHAEWSCQITARYLAQCTLRGNAYAPSLAGMWDPTTIAAMAFRYYLDNPEAPDMSLVTPPIDELKKLVAMAADGKQYGAKLAAIELARIDALRSLRNRLNGS